MARHCAAYSRHRSPPPPVYIYAPERVRSNAWVKGDSLSRRFVSRNRDFVWSGCEWRAVPQLSCCWSFGQTVLWVTRAARGCNPHTPVFRDACTLNISDRRRAKDKGYCFANISRKPVNNWRLIVFGAMALARNSLAWSNVKRIRTVHFQPTQDILFMVREVMENLWYSWYPRHLQNATFPSRTWRIRGGKQFNFPGARSALERAAARLNLELSSTDDSF
jgi:hypothetical protein